MGQEEGSQEMPDFFREGDKKYEGENDDFFREGDVKYGVPKYDYKDHSKEVKVDPKEWELYSNYV